MELIMNTAQIKELSTKINTYVENKEDKYIYEISDYVSGLFDASEVIFWSVDADKQTISSVFLEKKTVIPIESSLIKQVLNEKKVLIENHITSNKYYSLSIDNPLELKIKALMAIPVIDKNKVIGIVKLWRGIRKRKVFSKQDAEKLEKLLPIFVKLFKKQPIHKEELSVLLGEEKQERKKSVVSQKTTKMKTTLNSEQKNLQKEIQVLQDEKQLYIENEKKYKKEIVEHEKVLTSLKKDISKKELTYRKEVSDLQTKIDQYQMQLATMEEKYKKLEDASLELRQEAKSYQNIANELQLDLKSFKKENKKLQSQLKEKNSKSIKTLQLEKSIISSKNIDLHQNIEYILPSAIQHFSFQFVNTYMLFEFITYALSSKKGMEHIEKSIHETKLIQSLIDEYPFRNNLIIHKEKHRISDMKKVIKEYEKNIFSDMIDLNLNIDDTVPTSLVFDIVKVQNIILHLLLELYQFMDNNKDKNIDIQISYQNKLLKIEITSIINKTNSLWKKMFKQIKLDSSKESLELQFSKKMIGYLKGTIDSVYENNHYRFIVSIPMQVIKL
jgi:hypothetical protein